MHSNTTEFFSPYPSSSSKSSEAPALRNPPPRPRDLRHCRFRGRMFLVWPNDGWRAANERKKRTSLICWMREKESEKLSEDSQPQHEILSAAKACGFSRFRSTKIPSFAAGREKLVRGGKPHGHALERALSKEAAPKLSDHSRCQLERQKK